MNKIMLNKNKKFSQRWRPIAAHDMHFYNFDKLSTKDMAFSYQKGFSFRGPRSFVPIYFKLHTCDNGIKKP